ncbi:MAG: hypothetical protein WD120_02515 [Gemmatimonadota bacterium]
MTTRLDSKQHPFMPIHLAAWLLLLASTLPSHLHAQGGAEGETTEETAQWHGSLLVGSNGVGRNAHVFSGLEALWLPTRLGIGGGLQAGYGRGYRSTMVGGGLALQGAVLSEIRVHAWFGPAHYAERLETGMQRSVVGAGGAVYLYRAVGRWSLGLHLSGFAGTFDGPDFTEAAPVRTARPGLGIGYSYGGIR